MFEILVLKKEQDNANSFPNDSVINSNGKFKYNPEEEVTFLAYFRHYEEVFQKDCTTWSDDKKMRLLLRKFSLSEHEKYANYILLRIPGEISFEETVLILKKYFWRKVLYSTQDGCD